MSEINASHRFPDTRDSIVRALASDVSDTQHRALDLVVRAYRAPVIALLTRRYGHESADAEDLAQEFFTQAMQKTWLPRYDASKGRFRTFLRACLHAFVSTERQAANRLKRGGEAEHVSLDDAHYALATDDAVDVLFEREWVRSVLDIALQSLHAECDAEGRASTFAIFQRYDVDAAARDERPTYAELAAEFSLPVTQVTNYLAWARKRFRAHVLDTLRALAGSDAEYRADVRALIGTDAP